MHGNRSVIQLLLRNHFDTEFCQDATLDLGYFGHEHTGKSPANPALWLDRSTGFLCTHGVMADDGSIRKGLSKVS